MKYLILLLLLSFSSVSQEFRLKDGNLTYHDNQSTYKVNRSTYKDFFKFNDKAKELFEKKFGLSIEAFILSREKIYGTDEDLISFVSSMPDFFKTSKEVGSIDFECTPQIGLIDKRLRDRGVEAVQKLEEQKRQAREKCRREVGYRHDWVLRQIDAFHNKVINQHKEEQRSIRDNFNKTLIPGKDGKITYATEVNKTNINGNVEVVKVSCDLLFFNQTGIESIIKSFNLRGRQEFTQATLYINEKIKAFKKSKNSKISTCNQLIKTNNIMDSFLNEVDEDNSESLKIIKTLICKADYEHGADIEGIKSIRELLKSSEQSHLTNSIETYLSWMEDKYDYKDSDNVAEIESWKMIIGQYRDVCSKSANLIGRKVFARDRIDIIKSIQAKNYEQVCHKEYGNNLLTDSCKDKALNKVVEFGNHFLKVQGKINNQIVKRENQKGRQGSCNQRFIKMCNASNSTEPDTGWHGWGINTCP